MRKSISTILVLALVLTALAVLVVPANAAKLRIAIHRSAFGSMDVVAWKKGYFDKYLGKGNYSVHFFAQGKLINQAMLAGSVDTGTAGFVPWSTGVARGGKIVGFAATAHLCNLTRLMVAPGSPIKRVEDLKGKKVAAAKGASDTFTMEFFILPAHGLSTKDIRIVNTTNVDRVAMLRARSVEVILINEPTASIAEANGYARNLLDSFCKYDVSAMMAIVHPKTLKERRSQVVNYIRAWLKAHEDYRKDFEGYVKIFHEHQISKGVKVDISITRNALKKIIIKPELTEDVIRHLQKIAGLLKTQGRTPRVPAFFDKKENLDLNLLEEARRMN